MKKWQSDFKRASFLTSVLLVGSFLLQGCSGGSDHTTSRLQCPNPAVDIQYPRDTLQVSENLSRFQFDDFLRGYRPATADENSQRSALMGFLDEQIGKATNFTGEPANPETYTNAIDLVEEIIANDELSNLTLARSQMLFAIENDIGCRYNNQSVSINDGVTTLNYLIDFNYVPVTSENNDPFVSRTIIEFGAASNDGEDPGNASNLFFSGAASVATYDPGTFTQEGYNTPRSVLATWALSDAESLTLTKDYTVDRSDVVEYVNTNGIQPEGFEERFKRLKFVLHYASGQVDVFVSEFTEAIIGPDGSVVKDPTDEQLAQFQEDAPDWVATTYQDPGYDGDQPTPLFSYQGLSVSHR